VFTLWDGEEFGLLGSTEWAEKHGEELNKKAVVYMNSDSNGQGSMGAGGSHTLERFMKEVLGDLKDPKSGKTLLELPFYDGTENGEKTDDTLSVIGQPIPGDRGVAAPDPSITIDQMKSLTRWPVTVSYYDRDTKGEEKD